MLVTLYIFCYQLKTIPYKHFGRSTSSSSYLSLLVVVPDSVSKTLDIESLHAVFILFFPIVLLLHQLLLLLLSLHHGSLVVVHLVVHIILAHSLHGVLLIEFIEQLHEDLVVVVETLGLDFLAPGVVVTLHVVQDRVHKHSDVRILVREQFKHD